MRRSLRRYIDFALATDGGLKARVVRSAAWVGASEIIVAIVNFARSVVLARLLTPEAFGLIGLAGIALRVLDTLTRPGIAPALIARQGEFSEARDTAFSILAGRGLVLAVAMAAAAPLVARFYESSELQPILQVLALTFLIGGISNVDLILRQRELDFQRLTIFNQAVLLTGTAVTIALAFWLRNVWALVIGQLASSIISTSLSYLYLGGRPRLAWNGRVASELLSYGKYVTGSTVVAFIASELDNVVIGKMLGPEALGYYVLAFTLVHMATSNIAKVASSVLMPAYSKLQKDIPAVRNAYLQALAAVAFAVLPATAGLIIVAEPFTLAAYGEKWLPSVFPIQILAVFGMLRAFTAMSGYLFEGLGKPSITFRLSILRLLVIAPLIVPMVSTHGLSGAAVAVSAGMFAWLIGACVYLRRLIGVGVMDSVKALWRPLWTTAAMSVAILSLPSTVPLSGVVGLLGQVVAGIGLYSVLNFAYLRARVRDIRAT
jgi:O-antigen/teichoic acid export membrane protein